MTDHLTVETAELYKTPIAFKRPRAWSSAAIWVYLGADSGFPLELQRGQDVCLDGFDSLLLPPTGGGVAFLLWLDLG